jgi:uncharacterized DUF497 family protein
VSEDFDGFDWSETNRASHLDKHGIDFPIVASVDWSRVKKAPDARRRYSQPRSVALAYCSKIRSVLVNRIGRIISVRRANAEEIAIFHAGSTDRTDYERLRQTGDADIDYGTTPPLTSISWTRAHRAAMPAAKRAAARRQRAKKR